MTQTKVTFRQVPNKDDLPKYVHEFIDMFLRGLSLLEMQKESGWGYSMIKKHRNQARQIFEVECDVHLAIALYGNGFVDDGKKD